MKKLWKWSLRERAYINRDNDRRITIQNERGRTYYFVYHDGKRRALISAEDTFEGIVVWPIRTSEWITESGTQPMTDAERADIMKDLHAAVPVTESDSDPFVVIKGHGSTVEVTHHLARPKSVIADERREYYLIKIDGRSRNARGAPVDENSPESRISPEEFDVTRIIGGARDLV